MRTSTAYFAGAGTVVAAVVVGLGGGFLISNIVSPHPPKMEMSKLELRMSSMPIPATNASSEPVKNEAATQPKPVEAQAAEKATPPSAPPAVAPPAQAAGPMTQATSEKANSEPNKTPEAAFAKARDSDFKARDSDLKPRDADIRREARRAAEERRKAERRQQWAERRRPRQDQELREVEERVREETEPRQLFATEPVRLETPRIKFFGLE
jgi:hypothetical protein